MRRFLTALLVLGALRIPAIAAFPAPRGSINDFAHVLDDASTRELTALVRTARDQTTAEIAVVTVTSLDGMSIEEYANKLFHEWGIGKKGANNGVLILVAPSERTMRIEVGYGLEPVLPDGLAGEIIRADCLPSFRTGAFAQGILAGTRHVVAIVERGQPLSDAERRALTARRPDAPPAYFIVPFLGLFVAIGWFGIGLGVRSRTFATIGFGAIFGGVGTLLSLVPGFNAMPLLLAALALFMLGLGYRKGASAYWAARLRPDATSPSTGWIVGPSGSGGSDSSGGGGDSFGGGDSGGGGASGSW